LCALPPPRARVYWGVRLDFVDQAGAGVWETLAAAASNGTAATLRSSRDVRAWYAALHRALAPELDAALAGRHDRALDDLRSDLAPLLRRLLARDREIGHAARARGARLAAGLVQPGLFDARVLREASAQRRLLEQLDARLKAHVQLLNRLADPVRGGRRLLFVVAA
jgi:hypothetical protein